MSALSIRHMKFALREIEAAQEKKEAAEYARRPADAPRSHYWWIERKAKRNKNGKTNWIFVRDYFGTKSEAAEFFRKYFQNRSDGTFRLKHQHSY